jgi:hypothetical protein
VEGLGDLVALSDDLSMQQRLVYTPNVLDTR